MSRSSVNDSGSTLPPVLVTGSAGFIGTRLVACLRDLGFEVRGLDTAAPDVRERGDVRDSNALEVAIPEGGHVYHLASIVGVRSVLARPDATWSTILRGTENVCRIAYERGARVVFASSSEVYGDGVGRRLREDMRLPQRYGVWPRASYPEAKSCGESILDGFVARGGDGRVARLFNVSGPFQSSEAGMVLPTFVEAALCRRPLPVIGDGSDVRSFQHVDDAVAGLIALMSTDEARGRVVNIGSNETIAIVDLAHTVGEVLGRSIRIQSVTSVARYGAETTRCKARVPDTTLARALLGHEATRSLATIVLDLAGSIAGHASGVGSIAGRNLRAPSGGPSGGTTRCAALPAAQDN
ncbi:MAG: NAD-dependent epimerase/dehydratase family protein [Planctomycetes bacterium]|nr:NAD-dependent epimerase/dehydratase family protein [Planctomycetota bacterium]